MAETTFTSKGEVRVTLDMTWTEMFDVVQREIEEDVGSYELGVFNCEVVERTRAPRIEDRRKENQPRDQSGNVIERYYVWEAEGKIIR